MCYINTIFMHKGSSSEKALQCTVSTFRFSSVTPIPKVQNDVFYIHH